MNRKERRDLRKDKNLIRELYSIIAKYFPDLLNKFNELSDARHQSYITYNMKTICVTRLFGLLCGLTSLSTISDDDFNSELCIKNISNICSTHLEELPYWETIQDVFVNINIDELREIQKYIVKSLLRSKMFDKYKFNGAFQLLFDGTGLSNHEYNLNGNCLIRKHKDGKISYYKYVLECKLSVGKLVVSLDSEFIENDNMLTDKDKQDCEIKAFKRMVKRIKKNYPKYKFIITGDALYAVSTVIAICKEYNWNYIFNFKPDRLKSTNEFFEENILINNEVNVKNYYLSSNINLKDHLLNVIKYIEIKNSKTITFRYITNIKTNNSNIKDIVFLGRKRWNIENGGFYTQKHRTFDITHMSSRNDNAMKAHYFFIQFAHTIRQLLERGSSLIKLLHYKIKEVSKKLADSLTSTSTNLNNLNLSFQLRFDD